MAQDHGWVVAKPVLEDVEIGAAHAAKGDLDLHMFVAAPRLVPVEGVDISSPAAKLHKPSSFGYPLRAGYSICDPHADWVPCRSQENSLR